MLAVSSITQCVKCKISICGGKALLLQNTFRSKSPPFLPLVIASTLRARPIITLNIPERTQELQILKQNLKAPPQLWTLKEAG